MAMHAARCLGAEDDMGLMMGVVACEVVCSGGSTAVAMELWVESTTEKHEAQRNGRGSSGMLTR